MQIGVLALQGAFREHHRILEQCGCQSVEVRKPEHLVEIDGLIIPGGESTTIGKLLAEDGLLEPVRELGAYGLPILGTCAGMVLLADDIVDSQQPRIGLMHMTVRRNAYGRQVESFEADLKIPVLGPDPFPGVFIRAPYIETVAPGTETLGELGGKIIFVRQGNLLACAFHPELTEDGRLHRYFLQMCGQ